MSLKRDLRLVNTPNNIVKGKIEIDAQINKLYYRILNNIQRDNNELIIKKKKLELLTPTQQSILDELDKREVLGCRLTNTDIEEILKRKNDRTKDEIYKRFNALQSAIFKFTTGEKSSTSVQLIGRVDEDETGYRINLDAKLYKYLFYSLDVGYTPVNLATLFNLTGQYAQSLYVLLRSWTGIKKEITFTLEELREHFKIGSKYPAYSNFKQRVIMQAIDEINKTGSMSIDNIKEKKNGRSVESLTFTVTDHEPRIMPLDKETELRHAPLEWIDGIMVADKKTYNVLDAMYGDIKHGLAQKILKAAYIKFIKKDKNCNTIIDAKGTSFYILLAEELLEKHTENILNNNVNSPENPTEYYLYED